MMQSDRKALIRLRSVQKEYDERRVLDIGEAEFLQGTSYAVMGANGSGKSTMLRILAGFLRPDTGSVELDGNPDIGYLPQHPYSFGFSVQKNVEIALPKQQRSDERVRSVLESVGIWQLARQNANKLSGGEAQRLALARVLANGHDILLLDEPTASADINGTDLIERAVADYRERYGCMLIVCTHSPAQAMRMADIILFFEMGKIVEQGEPSRVLNDPRSPQVRSFLEHWRI